MLQGLKNDKTAEFLGRIFRRLDCLKPFIAQHFFCCIPTQIGYIGHIDDCQWPCQQRHDQMSSRRNKAESGKKSAANFKFVQRKPLRKNDFTTFFSHFAAKLPSSHADQATCEQNLDVTSRRRIEPNGPAKIGVQARKLRIISSFSWYSTVQGLGQPSLRVLPFQSTSKHIPATGQHDDRFLRATATNIGFFCAKTPSPDTAHRQHPISLLHGKALGCRLNQMDIGTNPVARSCCAFAAIAPARDHLPKTRPRHHFFATMGALPPGARTDRESCFWRRRAK